MQGGPGVNEEPGCYPESGRKYLWIKYLQNRRGSLLPTINAKLNYPSDGKSLKTLEQENDVLEAAFLADEFGAHTCFEVREEYGGDPINRSDVRGRA